VMMINNVNYNVFRFICATVTCTIGVGLSVGGVDIVRNAVHIYFPLSSKRTSQYISAQALLTLGLSGQCDLNLFSLKKFPLISLHSSYALTLCKPISPLN
jgi:hypothetical protein